MDFDELKNMGAHAAKNPGFASAARFLAVTDLDRLGDGRYPIDGERVFALVNTTTGRGREKAVLEAHRKYIDVQFCLTGHDEIGVRPIESCGRISLEYDAARDIMFFADEPVEWLTIKDDFCAILYPRDAHAPLSSTVPMKKVVIKIAVEA